MEFFEDTGEDIKVGWGKLSEDVQAKCTNAAKFATMTKEELEKVPANVLSSLKSVKGMTKQQFKNVKSKMVAAKLSSKRRANFFINLGKESIDEAFESLSNLGDAAAKWPEDQVTRVTNKLSQVDVWGPVSKWKSEQVDKMGNMIEGLSQSTLWQLPGHVLSNCTHLVKLRANQLAGLGESMYNMTATSFDKFLIAANPANLGAAMMNISRSAVTWTLTQVKKFLDYLLKLWGKLWGWSSKQISSTGTMIGTYSSGVLNNFTESALSGCTNLYHLKTNQLISLKDKMYNMTSDQLSLMLKNLKESELAASLTSLTSTAKNGVEFVYNTSMKVIDVKHWAPLVVKSVTDQLIKIYGKAGNWTSEQLDSLGSMWTGLNVTGFLVDVSTAVLLKCKNLVLLGAAQIRDLGYKIANMTTTFVYGRVRDARGKVMEGGQHVWTDVQDKKIYVCSGYPGKMAGPTWPIKPSQQKMWVLKLCNISSRIRWMLQERMWQRKLWTESTTWAIKLLNQNMW